MIYNKMLVVPKYSVNRWDKDSIRPGPVGSVGDVNVQVMLRKSSIDMPERFDKTFSKKNAAWSGSNVSDGSWYGWTSGGREATVISKAMPNIQTGGKTAIGWVMQNVVPTDRTRATKVTPLGRYGWDTTVGSVLKSKHTGDLFLPLPGGYEKSGLPRGSQFPRILAESSGGGVALPAADVPLTDPTFGDEGTIGDCSEEELSWVWVPGKDSEKRKSAPPTKMWPLSYPYRKAYKLPRFPPAYYPHEWPDIGRHVFVYDIDKKEYSYMNTSPCGKVWRDDDEPEPEVRRPMPGNQDKRRQDKKKEQEDEKNKKQKLR